MRGRDPARLLALVPLLFAVPVLIGIARSALDLVGVAHPFYGDISGTETDAVAVYLGKSLFHNPATGYSGLLYTPGFPFAWGALDHLKLWGGWGLLLVLAADLGLVAMVASVAYRPRTADRAERLTMAAGAVGIGALGLWLVSSIPFNFLFQARVDQPAWAAAFAGLLLVPRVASGSKRAAVASVLLLTVANWMKQSVLPADIAAIAWLAIEARAGRFAWRGVALFGGALVALNGMLLLLEAVLNGRWFWILTVTMPAARPNWETLGDAVSALLEAVAPALVVLAVMAGGIALDRRHRLAGWWSSRDGRLAILIALFVALDLVPALAFHRAAGSADNQFIGIGWALALLMGIAWGRAAMGARSFAVAAAIVAAAFAASQSEGVRQRAQSRLSVAVRPVGERARVTEVSPALIRYARHHSVYHPALSWVDALGERRAYQDHADVTQLLISGYQPRHLANALLDRHFNAVFLFEDAPADEREAGTGYFEDNYLWKLNEIVRANYLPAGRAEPALQAAGYIRMFFPYRSPGLYLRSPRAPRAAWMRNCFAPFDIGALRWWIRRGGGFWCRPGGRGDALTLVRTRAPASELRTAQRGSALGGELRVALPRTGGRFSVTIGPCAVRGRRTGRAIELVLSDRSGAVQTVALPGPRVRLRFAEARDGRARLRRSGGGADVALPAAAASHASLWASAGSGAAFDVGALRLAKRPV